MATRSFIAQKTGDSFEGVYCHWDGYPDCVGVILRDHYADPGKVTKLLSLGDISSLDVSVGHKHDFGDRNHGYTTYYGRDRGETDPRIKTKRFKSLDELMKWAQECGCEFFYLFENGQWKFADRGPQFFGLSDGSSFSEFKQLAME